MDHNHPDLAEDKTEKHIESSESKTGVGENVSHSHESHGHHVDDGDDDADADADADAEGYEDAESGEYVEYEQYADETGDGAEEIYEVADGEYAEDEGEHIEAGYEVAEAPYPLKGEEELHLAKQNVTQPSLQDDHSRSLVHEDANDLETTGEVFGKPQCCHEYLLLIMRPFCYRRHS